MKIAVGMSGGVDSSVAALLLKEDGHQVFGVSMSLWDRASEAAAAPQKHACYGAGEAQEIETAQRICDALRIPFHVFDCAQQYREIVLAYFQEEYQAGRTPNPCVRCNQLVKFGRLPMMIRQAGLSFDAFATGHYARVEFQGVTGRYALRKAKDAKKDQSYFLYRLSQEQLAQARFPLAQYLKDDVRAIARRAGLGIADIAESQDFYSGDYQELLCLPDSAGEIVDLNGRALGTHRGIWHYTIGQRKGLGIASHEPLYVIQLDRRANRVIVGLKDDALRAACVVSRLNWVAIPALAAPMRVNIKLRSTHAAADARIEPLADDAVRVVFQTPQEAVTPGQSAVFYDGDVVVGGGIIEEHAPT